MRNDQIFTPDYIVTKMLDDIGYVGDNIRTKTIFEPSFGAGAFLFQIVHRIFEYARANRLSKNELIAILDNVHGVEIDRKLYDKTMTMLNGFTSGCGIDYKWENIICGDATKVDLHGQYDMVVMNPPYIRCHDLDLDTRKHIEENFQFARGNTDLYVIFFELGIKALKPDGKLCCISPNSFLRNSSQKQFRNLLPILCHVESVTDYGSYQIFDNIATYTAITLLNMNKESTDTKYIKMKDLDTVEFKTEVDLCDFCGQPWSITSDIDKKFLKDVALRKTKLSDLCNIQYGLATNADKIYLVEQKDVNNFEKTILRPVIKGSTLDSKRFIIFPYTFNTKTNKYELIDEETLKSDFPKAYAYLLSNKDKLVARDIEKGAIWYQYGRSQGIQNSKDAKIVLKHVVSDEDKNCSITLAAEETLVYSGMFITVKNEDDYLRVMRALTSDEFCRYVKLIGKNMGGGYKSFNTAAVKKFGVKD